MPVGKNSGLVFLGRLNLEPTLDHLGWLAEIRVFVNLNRICLALGELWDESCAEFFVISKLDAFNTILRVLFPLKLGDCFPGTRIKDLQIQMSAHKLRVVFLANDEERIGWGIHERSDAWLSNLECFFACLHVYQMKAKLVSYCCLQSIKRRKLSNRRT